MTKRAGRGVLIWAAAGISSAISLSVSWGLCLSPSFSTIISYIDDQFERYLHDESGLNRRHIVDNRVHCCFYFISPLGHGWVMHTAFFCYCGCRDCTVSGLQIGSYFLRLPYWLWCSCLTVFHSTKRQETVYNVVEIKTYWQIGCWNITTQACFLPLRCS